MKPRNPYKPFNDAVKNIKPEPKRYIPANPYEPRDKSNTSYRPKPPTWGIAGTSRQGPAGTMGYRPTFGTNYKKAKSEIEITKGDPKRDLWIHGKFITMEGYRFVAKNYDQPSSHGINHGTISKLQIRHHNKIVANYDRCWDIKPNTPKAREALSKIMDYFDDRTKKFEPIVPKSKNIGHER